MSTKSVWLLSFLVLALAFGGFVSTASAQQLVDSIKIEAHDADDDPDNPYGIPLIRVTVEGELTESDNDVLGTAQFRVGATIIALVVEGNLRNGGHELYTAEGTDVVKEREPAITDPNDPDYWRYMIRANNDGEFLFTFLLPAELAAYADQTVDLWFGNEKVDLAAGIYDAGILGGVVGERDYQFAVQGPAFSDGDADDDVFSNGDTVEVSVECETAAAGPPLSQGREVEVMTILPDFSNLDSQFARGNSATALGAIANNTTWPGGNYDLTSWDETDTTTALDLYDLALDVDRAIRDGRLVIDESNGDYDLSYTISDDNINEPGINKRVFVHALGYPSVHDIFDAPAALAARVPALAWPGSLNMATWATGVSDADGDGDIDAVDIKLDNAAPDFDIAIIDPFISTPNAKWTDDGRGGGIADNGIVDGGEWETVSYVYKEGDTVRVIVQIDPHELTDQELDRIDDDEISATGNEDATVGNITLIGDLSALLDPRRVDLVTDGNNNGIPDDAEVYGQYMGGNGDDDDFDGADANVEDEEDDTTNGFNERYMYLISFEIDDTFRGVSGDRPYTTPPLPFRFMIQDDAGNQSYYSAWSEELYDPDTWSWRDITLANWNLSYHDGNIDGVVNPVYVDDPMLVPAYVGQDELFAYNGYPVGDVRNEYPSSTSYVPFDRAGGLNNANIPEWPNYPGYNIVYNWDRPWRITIDAAYPNVSRVTSLKQGVASRDPADAVAPYDPDPNVVKGAAVTPSTILSGGTANLISDGNFIYEISGNETELVTLEAHFPSDDDMYFVKFEYSDTGTTFQAMKGDFTGDYQKTIRYVGGVPLRESLLLYDIAGNNTDPDVPGARYRAWHDGVNGDDDDDGDADMNDDEVRQARLSPQSDNIDNDADGLVDSNDRDTENRNADDYIPAEDDDEDGIMNEDEYVVPAVFDSTINMWVARWTFDPVRIARILDITPGKPYAIRAMAYDKAGYVVESAAAPIYVVFNVMGPGVAEVAGTAKASLLRSDGTIVANDTTIPEGHEYTFEVTTTGTVTSVTLVHSMDRKTWRNIAAVPNPDDALPFRAKWTPSLDRLAANVWVDLNENGVLDADEPYYESGDRLHIRAVAGKFGPLGKYEVVGSSLPSDLNGLTFIPYEPEITPPPVEEEELPEPDVTIAVADTIAPVMAIVQAGDDTYLDDGALVPVAKDVILKAESKWKLFGAAVGTTAGTEVLAADLAALNATPPTITANLEDIFEANGITTVDTASTVVLKQTDPGTGLGVRWWITGEDQPYDLKLEGTDLNVYTWYDDISDAVFQSAVVHPDGAVAQWVDIPSTVDLTILTNGSVVAVSKWDTTGVAPGRYNLRCVSIDNAGNKDVQRALIVHVVVGMGKYAAFISDPVEGEDVNVTSGLMEADGTLISGSNALIEAIVYNDAADIGSITRVIFQYQDAGGAWALADSVEQIPGNEVSTPYTDWSKKRGFVKRASHSEWHGKWNIQDLKGSFNIRALVEDDQGYVNDGIAIQVTVTGAILVRTQITNFAVVPFDPDEAADYQNPRVSMKIAKSGSVSDIKIDAYQDVAVEEIRMVLKADEVSGSPEPENVRFEYKISGVGVDPKSDAGWTPIATDGDPAWEKSDWDINSSHELQNLKVSTVVYVRARAEAKSGDGGGWDSYVDETNYVPYVAFIFEETTEPTCTIARIEHDGTSLGDVSGEMRTTGGVLNVIPSVTDQADSADHRGSGIAEIELFYKLRRKASRDGSTLLWNSAGKDSEAPFAIVWDVDTADIAEGKYDLLMVATDQAGNVSSNKWDTRAHLESLRTGNIRVLIIDRPSTDAGPTAYVEDPDEFSRSGRLTGEKNVLVSASSYTGGVKEFWLRYSEQGAESWVEIDNDAGFSGPDFLSSPDLDTDNDGTPDVGISDSFTPVGSTYRYFYWDENGNKRYDAGEPVWLDEAGGNTGRYNDSKYTAEEDIIMGSPKPSDETSGRKFEDIDGEDAMKDLTGVQGVTKWADISGYDGVDNDGDGLVDADDPSERGVLTQWDFIWIDLDGDDLYDYSTTTGVAEPVVYCSLSIPWKKIMDLPPTNDTPFDLKTKARDLKDGAGKDGLWGAEYTGDVRVENIVFAVWKVNGRKVENTYDPTGSGGSHSDKEYKNEYQRVTGDTVQVQVYVWPYRSTGVDVQLWYRYDDSLYPGALDNNYNGFPDDGDDDGGSTAKANLIANSKWDGIDNDFDGTIDEEQRDKDGDDDKWGEVNVWRQATTRVVAGPTEDVGDWDDASGLTDTDNSFTVTLEWDVSGFEGEFQYQFLPVIVDAGGYGVDFNYSALPFTHSEARFPQSSQFYRPDKSAAEGGYFSHFVDTMPGYGYEVITGYKIIVDHQGPYTYTQVVKDSADYGDGDDPMVKSFKPLTDGSNDDMIVRTNDEIKDAPVGNDKRAGDGGDDYVDEPGEDNYRTYDIQAKVVSIAGGLDYTKTLTDDSGGVQFQYRVAGGTWNTLGYDYDPDYLSTFAYDAATGEMVVDNTIERGDPLDLGYVGAMIQYCGDWVNKDGNLSAVAPLTKTQRIVVSTWCLDNVDILDTAKFPLANGTEYEFRVIGTDHTDKYGDAGHSTDPDATSTYDEYVVENRVGDDKHQATKDRNFERDINWKVGAPFQATTEDIFRIPHKDIANQEAIRGPRSDSDRKDYTYNVNNIVPKAEIMQVDETSFAWTAGTGVDPVGLANQIDASVHEGDHVLVAAIANPDPAGAGTWGTTAAVGADMAQVRVYARPYPIEATTNTDYYKNWSAGGGSNGWMQVGMGDLTQADAGSEGYTIRIDTKKLVDDLSEVYDEAKVPPETRDFQLMAMAVDDHGNQEPFLAKTGEIVIRVLDMEGPALKLGGLALDIEHYRSVIGGAAKDILANATNGVFADTANLALNNFGNAVFPANPVLSYYESRKPVTKVSGELLHLYLSGGVYGDVDSVAISIIDKSGTVVASPTVTHTKDAWEVATETTLGEHDVIAGTVSHTFVLPEEAALLYLPMWTAEDGNNVSRFENVWLHYKAVGNVVDADGVGTGSAVTPGDPYFGDSKAMSFSRNSKGECIWTVTMDLELGKTYFYYFVVDTVGDTWVIPDPKNLMVDEFLEGNLTIDDLTDLHNRLSDWYEQTGAYTLANLSLTNNLFLNLPVVSKLWVPGTPGGDDNIYGADDELWTAVVDLDALPGDGVYEVRVKATDKIGYTQMISKNIVLDRTPPQVDPNIDIKVDSRVKANAPTEIAAIIRDGTGINVVETVAVVFQTSRRGNTEEAISTWRFAEAPPELIAAAKAATPGFSSGSSTSSGQSGVSQFEFLGQDLSKLVELAESLGIDTMEELTDYLDMEPDELQDLVKEITPAELEDDLEEMLLEKYNIDVDVTPAWMGELVKQNPTVKKVVDDLEAAGFTGSEIGNITWELAAQIAWAWYAAIAVDAIPDDGWTATWQTPRTDQNVRYYVRAVPFDDALNVYVGQTNQVEVVVDGSVPKAKVVKASVTRAGATWPGDGPGDADEFMIYPDDGDVLLIADMVENMDGDLDMDGYIDEAAGESRNLGTKAVAFEYSLNELKEPGNWNSDMVWYPIRASQYSDAVRVPAADGTWQAMWQVDFSKLATETKDQYIHVRALAEDDVGNKDGEDDDDPILTIMILNNITGPQAFIREVDGNNVLDPHLAVTKRTSGAKNPDGSWVGDAGAVDVVARADNVAVVTLEYRAEGETDWTTVKTFTGVAGEFTAEWVVATLDEGRYELRVTAFDGDGNMATDPDVVVVIVDHTEPEVTEVKIWANVDSDTSDIGYSTVQNYESGELIATDGTGIFRYAKNTATGEKPSNFVNVKVEAKASATDPTDRKVEPSEMVLQYFDKGSALWQTVKDTNGNAIEFEYDKTALTWRVLFEGDLALGKLIPQLANGQDGSIHLRVLATDYAGNQNNLDRGIEFTADAYAPAILAVYSGSREYIGGEGPTIVEVGGDTVDLWAKVQDAGTGVKSVDFRIPASKYNDTTVYTVEELPVPVGDVDKIGTGDLVEEHGGEYLFHMVWTTPLNMVHDKFVYDVTAKAVDEAGNDKTSGSVKAQVLVERDVTPPAAPEVRFLVTHAAGVTKVVPKDAGGVNPGVDARIFDEYCAPWYDENLEPDGDPAWWAGRSGERPGTIAPAPVRKIIDLAQPEKYFVFDTFSDWTDHGDQYIAREHLDNSVEIWVRTSELEYGVAGARGEDNTTWKQYEKYWADSSDTPNELETYPGSGKYPDNDSRSPQSLPVNYTSMGHDPGIIRVYLDMVRAPNQDGTPDDISSFGVDPLTGELTSGSWIPLDNRKDSGNGDGNQEYRRPTTTDSDSWKKSSDDYSSSDHTYAPLYMGEYRKYWEDFTYSWSDDEHRVNKRQEPLKLDDVVRVPLYEKEDKSKLKGYAYYWVMGDDDPLTRAKVDAGSGKYGETVWNTCASAGDDDNDLDGAIGKDGWYIIRTWAEDFAGNGNPYKDADRRNFGYAVVYVKNQDDIAPECTFSDWEYDGRSTGSGDRVVWEGWHMIRVYTKQGSKPEGYDWYFGAVGQINDVDDSGRDYISNRYSKFFCDVDFIAAEIQDPVTGEWVETGFSVEPYETNYMNDDAPSSRRSRWYIWADSTWVEDGATRLRVVLWDNGGKLTDGYKAINEEWEDGYHIPGDDKSRNYQDRGDDSDQDVEIDNPRARVVLPASASIVERGSTITVQAVPVSIADLAGNGDDVGRVKFYAKRKSVSSAVYNGPWVLLDAVDDDLDGLFGEDPVAGYDLDNDGKKGEDDIDGVDTNEPYLVRWTIPDWLVIDDPRTEADVEESADYYIVAVAGDSDTGPLSLEDYGHSQPGTRSDNPQLGDVVEPSDIIWDNMDHIVAHTDRYTLVTVQDTTPPRTRILQVGNYAVPSETKIVVGRTVTVQAGDTEVQVIPAGVFPFNPDAPSDVEGTNGLLMPPATSSATGLSGDYYDDASWTADDLWGGAYSAGATPYQSSGHPSDSGSPKSFWPNMEKSGAALYVYSAHRGMFEAEWRPEGRIQLLYAPAEDDGSAPASPQSGESWSDTVWKIAEANAIDMDDGGDPGKPDWKVENWVTGDGDDGKYYVTVVATDDVGHTTGVPVAGKAAVMPDMVEIWIDNAGPSVTLTAANLQSDGTLEVIANNEMERGQPLVLYIGPEMSVEDMDKVTFKFKAKHDYNWTDIEAVATQPYSTTLSPLGGWSGVTQEPNNIALGNVYQFKASAEDMIGNKADSNIIELTVVDKVAEASVSTIKRLDGLNADEGELDARMMDVPRLSGRVELTGSTDADVVGVTFLYRQQGAAAWNESEAVLSRTGPENWEGVGWLDDELDNDGDWTPADDMGSYNGKPSYYYMKTDYHLDEEGNWVLKDPDFVGHPEPNLDEADEGAEHDAWLTDKKDNDGDWTKADDKDEDGAPSYWDHDNNEETADVPEPHLDEADEGAEHPAWLTDGLDNDGDWTSDDDMPSYDGKPGYYQDENGNWVPENNVDEPGECGYQYKGLQTWTAVLDTTSLTDGLYELAVVANTGDNKSDVSDILRVVVDHNARDIVDAIDDWAPMSGDAVGGWARRPVESQNPILDPDDKLGDKSRGEVDLYVVFGDGVPADLDMGIPTAGTALEPALSFEYKESAYPDVGDETIHDKTTLSSDHWYWKPIESEVVYDAASRRFSAVWRTVQYSVLNGYYDIRVRVVDEAGNVAYKVIAEKVIVDNSAPDAVISSVDDDTTLTYENTAMATDTEIDQDAPVILRATAIDSLTSVAYVQFQVKGSTLQSGRPLAGNADEVQIGTLGFTQWTDIGLGVMEDDPANSYSMRWDTTGLLEGDYLLRVGVTDVVGNKTYSGAVKVTVVDTAAPVATIAGYYPEQYQFLYLLWPQKYRFDTIYAATVGQSDVQEVQFQYRGADGEWITIGVPALIPFEQLDTPEDKADEIRDMLATATMNLFPEAVRLDEAIIEAFDWTGLWGTTWTPDLPDGDYQLRAVAKDWSGNVDPDLAPILNVSVVGGVLQPMTPASGMNIDFTADLGGTGLGDRSANRPGAGPNYVDTPTVVLTVEADERPTVLVLVEVDSPEGLVFGGEIVDVKAEEGASGRWNAVLKGDELGVWIANQYGTSATYSALSNYLNLLRLGGKITAFASTSAGTVSTSLTMDDLRVFPVTAELGTNGTVYSKDGAVSVMIPRAALQEPVAYLTDATREERAGLMITPAITPNTPKDQRLILEPVGQAYNIEFFNDEPEYYGFRPGFEPKITVDYSGFDLPPVEEALGFIAVRYWDPQPGGDATTNNGRWANDDIINLSVDEAANTIAFNLKAFGYLNTQDNGVQHTIFSIVLEKSLGRIGEVVLYDPQGNAALQHAADPSVSYLTALADGTNGGSVVFRVVDPGGIDDNSIRVYIDGELFSVGLAGENPSGHCERLTVLTEDNELVYRYNVPSGLTHLTEGPHTLKIEAWDKSDAVNESNWMMLEKTVTFYIDTAPPQVVTHAAQRDGVRYFSVPEGAMASISVVDEGVGVSGADLQKSVFVDVFKYLTSENTTLRTLDQGNVVNFQRKTLQATSRPILEYADDYTPDGVDNETWVGIHDGASDERHQAWRASYTVHVGQIDDGDTYEVVFYAKKAPSVLNDGYNENAVYLYEDLSRAYLKVWDGANAEALDVSASASSSEEAARVVAVPATQMPDFYKSGLLNVTVSDPFTGYYQSSFLMDALGNMGAMAVEASATERNGSETMSSRTSSPSGTYIVPDQFFVRHLVADRLGPVVTLDVPEGVRADHLAATVSASVTDDASGIEIAQLVVNGVVTVEKAGPASNLSLDHTFGQGEAATANEIKIVAVDVAGNETVKRASFGVQEVDGPAITDMTPQGEGVADATPTIAAAYSDPSGIDLDSVTLTLNGAVMTDATVGASMVSYTPVKALKAGVTYTVKVSVKDTAGTASDAVWTFALETVAPSITDTTPSGVDETGTPVVSAKFSDDGTGVNKGSVKLMLDGKSVGAEATDSSVSYKPAAVLSKGKHTASLTVADLAGNVAEHAWEFNVEETAPSVSDVAPSGTINDDTPVLSARYSDAGTGIDINSVKLSLDGEVVQAEVTGSQVSYGVQAPLKTGVAHTVSVTVADKAGNVGTASSTFRLEGTAPSISNTSPTGTVQSVDVAISANYSDAGSGIDQGSAVMKVDGVVVAATPSASGISYQATGLLHGDHTVYVEVADRFGNVASSNWSFKVEETPPTIASVEPEGEVDTATPTLSASYSDAGSGINVNSVVLSLNSQVVPATVTESQVSYKVLTPLQLGVTYKVAVQVADRAGNIASGSSSFSLETDPPSISSAKPTGTVDEDEAASGVMISANLSDDGSGVNPDSLMMWLDGEPVDADATAESVQYMARGLAYGEHTVRVVVADMLGNTADKTWDFSVDDSTPPTVVVLSPKEDATVGVTPVIKISYADEGSGVDLTSIDVKIDGEAIMATAMAPAKSTGAKVVSAGEASYEKKLSYGAHTLTVVVKDVAGNEATAEVTFICEGDVLKLVKPHNYPNPFRGGSTSITFGLSQGSDITIKIYDFTATLVATIVDDEHTQADDKVEFSWDGTTDSGDGDQLANGVYFCQILAKTDSETKSEIVKIALVRE